MTLKGDGIMKEKVLAALNKIRPMLQRDGGDVELVEVIDGVVKVRLQGACAGCPMSQMTLKNGIERFLKQEIPEIKSVESAS
jgi:Fe-S cluster biogenesis protein NfuA